jgi:putative transposase
MARRGEDRGWLALWQEASRQGEDGFRRVLEQLVQGILEEEMTAFLGAEPYQRAEGRQGYRNGHKPRTLVTRVGTLNLLVPQDREGRFQTELFQRYQRNEKALVLALAEMYVQGVSTRRVKQITEALCGVEVSKSQVSALARGLDEEIALWRSRPLEKAYPSLVVDARYEKVRRGPRVTSAGVLLVVGIDEEGYREILGTWVADSESEATWSEVFAELRQRGLGGVRYVVSDDHRGLRAAIDRYFQGALWQRCQVHLVRNVLARVAQGDRARVVALLRAVTQPSTVEEARQRLKEAAAALRVRYPGVAALLEEQGEEMLTVYQVPPAHRKQLCSTNMLERYQQELRRRTRVVRIFPSEGSCLRLVTALAIETSEEWLVRRYLRMEAEGASVVGLEERAVAVA